MRRVLKVLAGLGLGYAGIVGLMAWLEPALLFPRPTVAPEQLAAWARAQGAEVLSVQTEDGLALYGWRLRAGGDHAGLAELLAERTESDPDPRTRDRCALERAEILEVVLDAVEPAVEIYRRLCTAAEAQERVLAATRLEGLLERCAREERRERRILDSLRDEILEGGGDNLRIRRVFVTPREIYRLELALPDLGYQRTTFLDRDALEELLEADDVREVVEAACLGR